MISFIVVSVIFLLLIVGMVISEHRGLKASFWMFATLAFFLLFALIGLAAGASGYVPPGGN